MRIVRILIWATGIWVLWWVHTWSVPLAALLGAMAFDFLTDGLVRI